MRLGWSDPFVQVTAVWIIQKTLNEPRLIPQAFDLTSHLRKLVLDGPNSVDHFSKFDRVRPMKISLDDR